MDMQENVGEFMEKVQELVLQFAQFSTVWLWAKMLLKDFQVSKTNTSINSSYFGHHSYQKSLWTDGKIFGK